MPASPDKLKIYSTTSAMPSSDAERLVGAHRSDFGSFQVFVLAPSKLKARAYIGQAFQGRGAAHISDKDLHVAAAALDPAKCNDSLATLVRAGLFADDGDVVLTDRDDRAGVVRIAGAVEADGDPQLVGRWDTARDADDFPVKGFHRADGVVFAEPVDELHKRLVLEDRAEKAARAAALTNVRDFLAAHEVMATAPATTTDPQLIHSIGTNDRESGRIDLTINDLKILLGLAEGRR